MKAGIKYFKDNKILVVVFLGLTFISSKNEIRCDKSNAIYRVYNACLDSLVDSIEIYPKFILNDSTIKISGGANKDIIKLIGDKITHDLIVNYGQLNKEVIYLDRSAFHHRKKILYLSGVNKILNTTTQNHSSIYWSELKAKFPMVRDIISFSRVSLTSDLNYAVVLFNSISERRHSLNCLVFLKKDKKKYKIIYVKT